MLLSIGYEQPIDEWPFPQCDINEDGTTELKDHSLLCAHWDEPTGCSALVLPGEQLEKLQKPWMQWERRPFVRSQS